MSVGLDELSGGGKAWSANAIGDKVKGRIKLVERRQQTDMDSGEKLTWDDGSPRMLLYIELETDERDPDIEDDDGVRALYAKGGNHEPAEGSGTSMQNAIVEAVKKAGAKSVDEGAMLQVAHTGLGKRKNRGFNPAKLYKAHYEAPKSSVSDDDLFGDD